MADYISVAELRSWMGIVGTSEDTLLDQAITASTAWINEYCAQDFSQVNQNTPATQRAFYAQRDPWRLFFAHDSIADTVNMVVKTDDNEDGTPETTWAASDWIVESEKSGHTNGPYYAIRAVNNRWFPRAANGRPLVYITARWGWPTTPNPVKQAQYILAAEFWKMRDAPFGVAGFGEFGVVRVRKNMIVAQLLEPYRRGFAVL